MAETTVRYPRILVAVDPAGCAVDVCEHAAALATALGSEVTLLHVVHEPSGVPAKARVQGAGGGVRAVGELLDEDAGLALRALTEVFVRAGRRVDTVVRHGAPASTILDEARAAGAALLVMGTHGRTGARHLLFGSVAEQVLRHATCPVVVVRAPVGMADVSSRLEQSLAAEGMG